MKNANFIAKFRAKETGALTRKRIYIVSVKCPQAVASTLEAEANA